MDKAIPSRPTRTKKAQPEPQSSAEETTPTTEESGNKYAPKAKIGKPTIGVPNRVETVGLGNLKVITTNGYTDV